MCIFGPLSKQMSSGSPVHDVELTGFAASDVLNPCYFVSRSLDSDIPFFYPGHTKSAVVAGLGPGTPVCGSLLGLCNPVYAFGLAVVAGLGPGPPVCGSLLGLCNPVYALKSAVVAGLGPGPPVPGSLLGLCNPVYAFGSAVVAGLGPGPPVHEFLPFLDPIHSPNYAWSTTALNFESSSLPLCRKRLVLDASVILYLSIFLISLCDNLCVLLLNESYCCTQEFLFMNCATLNNNTLQRVVNILSLLLLVYPDYFLSISLPFIILLECKLESLVVNCRN